LPSGRGTWNSSGRARLSCTVAFGGSLVRSSTMVGKGPEVDQLTGWRFCTVELEVATRHTWPPRRPSLIAIVCSSYCNLTGKNCICNFCCDILQSYNVNI
jgi:hypothetical protein